jgi:hypothetical protein
MSFWIASEVRPLATYSKYLPREMKVMSMADVSKKTNG